MIQQDKGTESFALALRQPVLQISFTCYYKQRRRKRFLHLYEALLNVWRVAERNLHSVASLDPA